MGIKNITDYRVPFGSAANQLMVWNDATDLYEVSVSLSGLTLVSPIISGPWDWIGSSVADWSDDPKSIILGNLNEAGFLQIRDTFGLNWLTLNPALDQIDFGHSSSGPDFNFAGDGAFNKTGTGLTTLGGSIDVTGKILANGGFIGDDDDSELIGIDGFNGEVTVDGKISIPGVGVEDFFSVDRNGTSFSMNIGNTTDISTAITSGSFSSIFSQARISPPSASSALYTGFSGIVTPVATTSYSGDISGQLGKIDIALFATSEFTGILAAVKGELSIFASSTDISDMACFHATASVSNFGGGVFDNLYGLLIEDITGADNNWSIYSQGGNMAHAGNVRIGSLVAPTEALDVTGTTKTDGFRADIETITSDDTLDSNNHTVLLDGTSNTVTATLPTAVGNQGRIYNIKSINATFLTDVATDGSEEIDGDSSNFTLAKDESITIQSDGSNWWII